MKLCHRCNTSKALIVPIERDSLQPPGFGDLPIFGPPQQAAMPLSKKRVLYVVKEAFDDLISKEAARNTTNDEALEKGKEKERKMSSGHSHGAVHTGHELPRESANSQLRCAYADYPDTPKNYRLSEQEEIIGRSYDWDLKSVASSMRSSDSAYHSFDEEHYPITEDTMAGRVYVEYASLQLSNYSCVDHRVGRRFHRLECLMCEDEENPTYVLPSWRRTNNRSPKTTNPFEDISPLPIPKHFPYSSRHGQHYPLV
jgi:hypothetical protein